MRVYRYRENTGSRPRIGIGVDDRDPVDLLEAGRVALGEENAATDSWLTSTLAMIEAGPGLWATVAQTVRDASEEFVVDPGAPGFQWLCPLDRLASLRDFLAFESHVQRAADRRKSTVPPYWYEAPVYYKGNHRSIIGPDEECPWPAYTDRLDFELELAMVVGVRGRDIAADAADDFVFGFTVMNDFSARDIQAAEMSAWLGPAKGKDFATALGPRIVTADEIGAQPDLGMVCRVNGEEWGRARSADAHWSWADMLAHVSRGEDVWPGDVYGSGTPGGCCGLDIGRELSPGDVVELEIEKIGVLRNQVGSKRA